MLTRMPRPFSGGYLDQGGDFQACRVLNLYKAHRAWCAPKYSR